MIIDLDTETENLITSLANQEQTSAAQLIKKAMLNYFESNKQTAKTLADSTIAELIRNPLQVNDFTPLSREEANAR